VSDVHLDPELLRTEFLGLSVRYDDIELPREDLAMFFAQECGHYGLTRFEYLAEGGGAFSGGEGAEFALRPGGAASGGVIRLGIGEGSERISGLLGEAIRRFAIGPMWIEDVTLVAMWDSELDDAGRQILAEEILRIDDDRLALVGDDDLSVGLRMWRSMGEGSIDISVEPMHADPAKLYLRLAYGQPDPVSDLAGILNAIDSLHEFLQGPLKAFVLAQARSSG
jgi:hypothetical protein